MRLKPWRIAELDDATDHRRHGRIVERDRAAQRHVVFGHAVRNRRGDEDRLAREHAPRRALGHLLRQPVIDHAGQVRPVLLGGADRHDDDGVGARPRRDLGRLEPRPIDFDVARHRSRATA